MFTFRCPGCGKQHTTDKPFEGPFEAKCLRCGGRIPVTRQLVHETGEANLQQAITRHPKAPRTEAAAGAGMAAGGGPGAAAEREDVLEEVDDRVQPAPGTAPGAEGGAGQRGAAPRRGGRPPAAGQAPRGAKPARQTITSGREQTKAEADAEAESRPGAKTKPVWEPGKEPSAVGARPWWKSWAVLAGAAAVVLLTAGGGAYLLFGRGKGPAKKEVAKSTNAPKPAAPAHPPAVQTKRAEPAVKPLVEAVKVSAPRLAAELAAAPAEAGAKYEGKTLEVSGLFDRMDQEMQGPGGPPRLHPLFAAAGAPVRCDLDGSPTDARHWQGLAAGQPFTVRGVYSSRDGALRGCELLPPTPPADARWKGKEVELSGFVDTVQLVEDGAPFPTIQLEPETFGGVIVRCLFRKSDGDEVKKLQPGTPVTVHGTCGGREGTEPPYSVRLDNCQLVYTTAPTPPTLRLEVAPFLRDYAEDLRRDLLPAAGTEERLETPVIVTQLAREVTGDGTALEKKYRYKVLTVSGRVLRKMPGQELLLESENTDQLLKVACFFPRHAFAGLDDTPELSVRGLCTGMQDPRTLRLDNCEPFDPSGQTDRRRLTADYLPHKPGRALTYDLAQVRSVGRADATVVREVFFEREGGLTETLITHTGSLEDVSLLDKGDQGKWAAQTKTRKVRLPGPVYQHRLSGGFVEVGQQVVTKERQLEAVWEPALKIGARVGDTWKWYYANTEHKYRLEKFDEHKGRPCAIITEVVITNADEHRPVEVRHVYVRDLGEVERQESLRLPTQERKVLAEKKLVEDLIGPARETPAEKKESPAEKPGNSAGEKSGESAAGKENVATGEKGKAAPGAEAGAGGKPPPPQ